MIDLMLTDNEIYGEEPSFEVQELTNKNEKLKDQLYVLDRTLDKATECIEQINFIINKAILDNIKKTNKQTAPVVIRSYREALLVYREIEEELKKYNEFVTS